MVRSHPPPPPKAFPIDTAASVLRREVALALDRESPKPGDRWLVAFSGGPDSLALAAALAPLAAERGLELRLLHVDHRLDPDSGTRAGRARLLAGRLGLPFEVEAVDVAAERRRGESPESAARRMRYAALERWRDRLGATRILTAHQQGDQVETVLLRLLRGGPVESLAGIPARRGPIVRPLLEVDRRTIEAFLQQAGLEPIDDPTNRDPAVPRNLVRHHLLPSLRQRDPGIDAILLAISRRAAGLANRLETLLEARFKEASIAGNDERGAAGLPIGQLLALPEQLRPRALRRFLARATPPASLSFPSMEIFLCVLARHPTATRSRPVTGDGPSRRLVAAGGRLRLEPAPAKPRPSPFSYTASIPGEVELPELDLKIRIRRSPVERWMFRGDPRRAALAIPEPVQTGVPVATIRSRRPGDRLRPLSGPGQRKLKALLIDRKVPLARRDRLPILEIGGRIAWIPGLTIDEAFRLRPGATECLVAELEEIDRGGNVPPGEEVEPGERKDR